jgi:non-ribosomal peptide synthetase component F/acyl carrier protein/ubiquinone/menaquinone biosynthesis C-methylase UbiE
MHSTLIYNIIFMKKDTMPKNSIIDQFIEQVKNNPDKIAIVEFLSEGNIHFQNAKLFTYQEVYDLAFRLACFLQNSSGSNLRGSKIILCPTSNAYYRIATLAIRMLDATIVPLNARHPEKRKQLIIKNTEAKLIIDNPLLEKFLLSGASDNLTQPIHNSIALILFTSGTTGQPKGVVISDEAVLEKLEATAKRINYRPDDLIINLTNPTFDIAWNEIWGPLVHGGKLAVTTTDISRDASALCDYIIAAKKHASRCILQATPSQAWLLINYLNVFPEKNPFEGLTVILAGEALRENLINNLRKLGAAETYNFYGPTEAVIWCTASKDNSTIGKPLKGNKIKILNKEKMPVKPGEIGELYVGGAIADRYFNRQDLTYQKFPTIDGMRMFATGDMVKELPSGEILFLGRFDDQVKIRGNRVELGDVEKNLENAPNVQRAAAIVIEQNNSTFLIVFVVPKSSISFVSTAPSDDDIKENVLFLHYIEGANYFNYAIRNKLKTVVRGTLNASNLGEENFRFFLNILIKETDVEVEERQKKLLFNVINRLDPTVSKYGIDEAEITQYCETHLVDYMRPTQIRQIDKIPTTNTGDSIKINRRALQTLARKSMQNHDLSLPKKSSVEDTVQNILKSLLGIMQLPAGYEGKSFFTLGGDSLRLMTLFQLIHKFYKVTIPFRVFLDNLTIRRLIEIIKQQTITVDLDDAAISCLISQDEPVTSELIYSNQEDFVDSGSMSRERASSQDDEKILHPLTYAQERLAMLTMLEEGPSNSTYNLHAVYNADGKLSIIALYEAMMMMVKMQKIFRTLYVHADGNFKQQILTFSQIEQMVPPSVIEPFSQANIEQNPHPFLCVDMQGENPEKIDAILKQNLDRVFNLQSEVSWRIVVLQTSPNRYIISFIFHHICMDPWSQDSFFELFNKFYRECSHDSSLDAAIYQGEERAAESKQVIDIAYDEHRFRNSAIPDEQTQYWLVKLANLKPVVLPTDYIRQPSNNTHPGKELMFTIDGDVLEEMTNFSKIQNLTLFTYLTASVSILLHLATGQQDIVFGTAVAKRAEPGTQKTIGFLIDVIPLRYNVDPTETFVEFSRKVSEDVKLSLAYCIPFQRLIKLLKISGKDLFTHPHIPGVQIGVIYQDCSRSTEFCLPEVTITPCYIEDSHTKLELILYFYRYTDRIVCRVQYSTLLFRETTIVNLIITPFLQLLRQITKEPNQKIRDLSAIACKIEENWGRYQNNLRMHFPKNQTIIGTYLERFREYPKEVKIIGNGFKFTLEELTNMAANLAGNLQKDYDIQPQTFIAICFGDNPYRYIALLAVLLLRCTYVPLDPDDTEHQELTKKKIDRISIILTQPTLVERIAEIAEGSEKKIVALSTTLIRNGEGLAGINSFSKFKTDDAPFAISTSGTTGEPKLVVLENQLGILNLISYLKGEYGLQDGERSKPLAKLFTIYSFSSDGYSLHALLGLLSSSTLVLSKDDSIRQTITPALADFIVKHDITHMGPTAPNVARLLSSFPPEKLSKLKVLGVGSDTFPTEVAIKLLQILPDECTLYNLYGPTETNVVVSVFPMKKDYLKSTQPLQRIPIGNLPIPEYTFLFLAEDEGDPRFWKMAIPGSICRLFIQSDLIAMHYEGQPELTKTSFIEHEEYGHIYNTNDLVRLCFDNVSKTPYIEHVGRVQGFYKKNGFRIDLEAIKRCTLTVSPIKAAQLSFNTETNTIHLSAAVDTPLAIKVKIAKAHILSFMQMYDQLFSDIASSESSIPQWKYHGWRNQISGNNILPEDLEALAKYSSEQIISQKAKNLLILGCGTLVELEYLTAPGSPVKSIYASDFSSSVIATIQQRYKGNSAGSKEKSTSPRVINSVSTKFSVASANESCLGLLPDASFDVVYASSVFQYFPDINYLSAVLYRSLPRIKPGGQFYICDVRNLRLLPILEYERLLNKVESTINTIEQLKLIAQHECYIETQLHIDPEFFVKFAKYYMSLHEGFIGVELEMRLSSLETEEQATTSSLKNDLKPYRYNVKLHVLKEEPQPYEVLWEEYDHEGLIRLRERLIALQNNPETKMLAIKNIPNKRLARMHLVLAELEHMSSIVDLKNFYHTVNIDYSIEPDVLLILARNLELKCRIAPSLNNKYNFDAVFYTKKIAVPPLFINTYSLCEKSEASAHIKQITAEFPFHQIADETMRLDTIWNKIGLIFLSGHINNPLISRVHQIAIESLWNTYEQKLPAYMHPQSVIFTEEPLPNPSAFPPGMGFRKSSQFIAARSGTFEPTLVSIWEEVLHQQNIGIRHNFFTNLGGDSRQAIAVIVQISTMWNISLTLIEFYRHPTIADLNALIFHKTLVTGAPSQAHQQRSSKYLTIVSSSNQAPTARERERDNSAVYSNTSPNEDMEIAETKETKLDMVLNIPRKL